MASPRIPLNQPSKLGPPLPVPSQGLSYLSAFAISYSTVIAASPLQCIEKLLDTSTWSSWNTLCPSATITSSPLPITEETVNASELRELIAREPGRYLYTGVNFTVVAHLTDPKDGKAGNPTKEEVLSLERFEREGRTGYRITWKVAGQPWALMHAERVQEFIEAGDQDAGPDACPQTEYYCWETFGGIAWFGLRYVVGAQMAEGFGRWMTGFKDFVEAEQQNQKT